MTYNVDAVAQARRRRDWYARYGIDPLSLRLSDADYAAVEDRGTAQDVPEAFDVQDYLES